jgi:carboxymethylenebutenolidase
MGELIDFPSNGSSAQGYLATPESGAGLPIVVIQEWWGLVPHIKNVCDRAAADGFVALAPDLYNGKATTEPDEAGKAMMALTMADAAKAMSGAVDEVRRRSGRDKVGVIGFCMGGGLTLVLACQRPDAVKAAVPCYGLIPWPDAQPDYSALDAAVLIHSAENDDYFPPAAAHELVSQLQGLGKDASLDVHPGVDHAFFNDDRPEVYNAEEAAKLWRESVSFFNEHLA